MPPQTTTGADQAARRPRRPIQARTGAARANRATASHAGSSPPRATLLRGTVSPNSTPPAVSARNARWVRPRVMHPSCVIAQEWRPSPARDAIICRSMGVSLDELDVQLLDALQRDAD